MFHNRDMLNFRRSRRKPLVLAVAALGVFGLGAWMFSQRGTSAAEMATPSTPQSRNAARQRALDGLAMAIRQYTSSKPKAALVIPTTPTAVCAAVSSTCKSAKLVDLNALVSAGYISNIPNDPVGGTGHYITGYMIARSGSKIVISAPRAEDGAQLSVTIQ